MTTLDEYIKSDLLINGKLYDSEEVFSINDDMNMQVKEFLNQKVIVIDNFYNNPDLVREVVLSSTATRENNMGYPGYRTEFFVNQKTNIKKYNTIINSIYSEIDLPSATWIKFNLVKSPKTYPFDSRIGHNHCQPHFDKQTLCKTNMLQIQFAGICYLNKNDEFSGKNGTGFYRHKPTGISNVTEKTIREHGLYKELAKCCKENYGNHGSFISELFYDWNYEKDHQCENWINEGDDIWELIHFINMKYNRMIFYPSSYFHSAYFNDEDFITNHRIVQPIFLKGKNYSDDSSFMIK